MKLDLYTLYVYNYGKEYLFQKTRDLEKITEFSKSSNCIFKDKFYYYKTVATNVLQFYKYLETRDCFKIGLLLKDKENLVLKCYCRFSLEYWENSTIIDENTGETITTFLKDKEELWIKKFLSLTKKEEEEYILKLKMNDYKDD
ncbi:MAG: hypothetical protein ACRDCB_02225 [Clostridium sp.]|uniref:hypothetical protein n=1 Tax=Clostridium TaxID=1485 RepID=UPI00215277F9|nr:hypothetical protein [Clostridium sp. LY3-2]MCR6513794.1 hypothetical protein [Clostridium sp. LY3-2]